MKNADWKALWKNMSAEQKAQAESVFREKMESLCGWHAAEWNKINEKLKSDGRYRKGLDTNSDEPEMLELSAEYRRRFDALPDEVICEVLDAG